MKQTFSSLLVTLWCKLIRATALRPCMAIVVGSPTSPMVQMLLATQGGATPNFPSDTTGKRYLTPDDFAKNFDSSKPLYKNGEDGSPYSIVIVGQSRIDSRTGISRGRRFWRDAPVCISFIPTM